MFRFRYCFQIKFKIKKMKMAMRVLVVNRMSPKSMMFSFSGSDVMHSVQ